MTAGQDRDYQRPQPVRPAHFPLLILADDLTGACDAAVAFTTACGPVRFQLNAEPSAVACVQAITTESRDLPPAEAETRVRNIAKRVPSSVELFKKIDSVFRGNTVTEIVAALRHARFDLAVMAPAYPAMGRTLRDGVLYIQDASGERTLPIAKLLADAGCSFTALPPGQSADEFAATLYRRIEDALPALLCDATSQDDLTRIVRAARSFRKRILWIGSGGLAHALASELPPLANPRRSPPRPGHTIFFIGSPHAVTRAQIEHLQRVACIRQHRSDTGPLPESDLLVPVTLGETTPDDIRRSVGAHDPAQTGCLFMTGGDTAHFVCRALGIHSLHLLREFAPGVPLAIAEGGPFDGVSVVLKSGGFGEPDLLYRLLEAHRSPTEVIA